MHRNKQKDYLKEAKYIGSKSLTLFLYNIISIIAKCCIKEILLYKLEHNNLKTN